MVNKKKKESRWSKIFSKVVSFVKGASAIIGFCILISGIGITSWFVTKRAPVMGSWTHEGGNSGRTHIAIDNSGPTSDAVDSKTLLSVPEEYEIIHDSLLGADGRIYYIMCKTTHHSVTLDDVDVIYLDSTLDIETMREIHSNECVYTVIIKVINDGSITYRLVKIPPDEDRHINFVMSSNDLLNLDGIDRKSKITFLVDSEIKDHASFEYKNGSYKNNDYLFVDERKYDDSDILWESIIENEAKILGNSKLAYIMERGERGKFESHPKSFTLDKKRDISLTLTINRKTYMNCLQRYQSGGILVCADADTGVTLWEYAPKTPNWINENSTVVYSNEKVLIACSTDVYVLEAVSGILIKNISTIDETNPFYSYVMKPVFASINWDKIETMVNRDIEEKVGDNEEDAQVNQGGQEKEKSLKRFEFIEKVFSKPSDIELFDYIEMYTDIISYNKKYKTYLSACNVYTPSFDNRILDATDIDILLIKEIVTYKHQIFNKILSISSDNEINRNSYNRVPPKQILEYEIVQAIETRLLDSGQPVNSQYKCVNDYFATTNIDVNVSDPDNLKELKDCLSVYCEYRWLKSIEYLPKQHNQERLSLIFEMALTNKDRLAEFKESIAEVCNNKGILSAIIDAKIELGGNIPSVEGGWTPSLEKNLESNFYSKYSDEKSYAKSICCCVDNIYVLTENGYLLCYDEHTLKAKWITLVGCKYSQRSKLSASSNRVAFFAGDGDEKGFVTFTEDNKKHISVDVVPVEAELKSSFIGSGISMNDDFMIYLDDDQLILTKSSGKICSIEFPDSYEVVAGCTIDDEYLYVYFNSGLYCIDLDELERYLKNSSDNQLFWDEQDYGNVRWSSWRQGWQTNANTSLAVYDDRIVVVQADCIRAIPLWEDNESESRMCVWAVRKDHITDKDKQQIDYSENLIIFNSSVYVPYGNSILMIGDSNRINE